MLAQNTGSVLDAAVLAMYLTGHYPHLTDSAGQKHVVMGKALIAARLRREAIDPAPVWCVTTELGLDCPAVGADFPDRQLGLRLAR